MILFSPRLPDTNCIQVFSIQFGQGGSILWYFKWVTALTNSFEIIKTAFLRLVIYHQVTNVHISVSQNNATVEKEEEDSRQSKLYILLEFSSIWRKKLIVFCIIRIGTGPFFLATCVLFNYFVFRSWFTAVCNGRVSCVDALCRMWKNCCQSHFQNQRLVKHWHHMMCLV